ncbi:MAG: hypothetical protein U0R80_14225 [Nocardioidaceae bacterium]
MSAARRRPVGPTVAAALLAVLALVVSGCQGDGSDDPPPTTGSGSSPSEPTGASGSGGSPTGDPGDPVPADGPLVLLPDFELNVPRGFEVDAGIKIAISASDPTTHYGIVVGHIPGALQRPLGAQVAQSRELNPWQEPRPRRLPDVTLAGARWYHLSGRMAGFDHTDEFGTWLDDTQVRLIFSAQGPQQDDLIASVLASFAWR